MKKLIISALLLATCASAAPVLFQNKYSCDGGKQITVSFNSLTVDGKQHAYVDSAQGVGRHKDGAEYNISGAEYEGGWVFVTGETANSGLLVNGEDFHYCEVKR